MVCLVYSDEFLLHDTDLSRPERPECLTAVVYEVKAMPWVTQLRWRLPTPIAQRSLLTLVQQVHSQEYIQKVKDMTEREGGELHCDKAIVSWQIYDVVLLAVNAWLDGVDQVLATRSPTFVLAQSVAATLEGGLISRRRYID
jgi:acetoin utilization deacetylase AcuC-like enzyme